MIFYYLLSFNIPHHRIRNMIYSRKTYNSLDKLDFLNIETSYLLNDIDKNLCDNSKQKYNYTKNIKFSLIEDDYNKPKFIILLGPPGVGKSLVMDKIYKLDKSKYDKIEKDKYITENINYIRKINELIQEYGNENVNEGKKKIKSIINNNNIKEKKKLIKEFNDIYNSINSIDNCVAEDFEIGYYNCYDYHDKKLIKSIKDTTKSTVLEINGANNFSWIFENLSKEVSIILKTNYDIEFLYLSSNLNELFKYNKDRFENALDNCNLNTCNARLGVFLLQKIYNEIIIKIFETHEEMEDIIKIFKIKRKYYKRINNNYTNLHTFDNYKQSFKMF